MTRSLHCIHPLLVSLQILLCLARPFQARGAVGEDATATAIARLQVETQRALSEEPIRIDEWLTEPNAPSDSTHSAIASRVPAVCEPAFQVRVRGDTQEALQLAERLWLKDPTSGPAFECLLALPADQDSTSRLLLLSTPFQSAPKRLAGAGNTPDRIPPAYVAAAVFERINQLERALQKGKEALAQGCRFGGCYRLVARTFQRLNQREAGAAYFEALLKQYPSDPSRSALTQLSLLLLRQKADEPHLPLEELEALQAPMDPGLATEWLRDTLIEAYLQARMPDKALAQWHHRLYPYIKAEQWGAVSLYANQAYNQLYQSGAYSEARDINQVMLWSYLKLNVTTGQHSALMNLAACDRSLGRLIPALARYQLTETLTIKLHKTNSLPVIQRGIGHVFLAMGELPLAIRWYKKALETAQLLEFQHDEGLAEGDLGRAYQQLKQYKEAEAFLEKAIQHLLPTKDMRNLADNLHRLGQVMAETGRERQALILLQQSLSELKKRHLNYLIPVVQASISRAYFKLGDLEQARRYSLECLSGLQQGGYKGVEARARLEYAEVLMAQANAKSALQEARTALQQGEEVIAEQGSLSTSNALFSTSVQHFDLILHALLDKDLTLNEQQDRARVEESLQLGEKARVQSLRLRMRELRGNEAATASGPYAHEYAEALQHRSTLRMLLSLPGMTTLDQTELRDWLERTLEVVSASMPSKAVSSRYGSVQKSLTDLQQQTLTDSALQQLRRDAYQFWDDRLLLLSLLMSRQESASAGKVLEPVTLSTLQGSLPEDTLLLAYYAQGYHAFGWAITRHHARVFRLPDTEQLTVQVEALLQTLQNPRSPLQRVQTAGFSLFTSALSPVQDLLPAARRLLIIPDGPLARIPFEALSQSPWKAGQVPDYLGMRFPIEYLDVMPTAAQPDATPVQHTPSAGMLMISDPVYPLDRCGDTAEVMKPPTSGTALTESWHPTPDPDFELLEKRFSRLCNNQRETDGILQAWEHSGMSTGHDSTLAREESSEAHLAALPLQQFQYIHFNTHGIADPDRPDQSALILTPPQDLRAAEYSFKHGWNGFLEPREILQWKLNTTLVTLSACETGEGRSRQGEGIPSLAQAFLMAGSQRVMASLWAVNAASTAAYMTAFYQGLRQASIPDAMYHVRRLFLQNSVAEGFTAGNGSASNVQSTPQIKPWYSHPYFWAPFVLIRGGLHTTISSP